MEKNQVKKVEEKDLDPRDQREKFELKNNLQDRRLKVFDVKCGDIVQVFRLFDEKKQYNPQLVDHEVVSVFWNKGVTDYTDYYRKP